jgi:hypothetical protein
MHLKIGTFMLAVFFTNALYSRTPPAADTSGILLTANNIQLSDKAIGKLQGKYIKLEGKIDKQALRLLDRVQKQERRLQKMMHLKDSMAAKQLFGNAEKKYQALRDKLRMPVTKTVPRPLQEYIPRLDSLRTAFHFLGQQHADGAMGKVTANLTKVQELDHQFEQVQGRLQQAGEIKDFIKQREQELKDRLTKYGLGSKLLGLNKEVYYYQQQLSDYKNIWNDQEKLEKTVLGLVRKVPAFETFMQKNSYLGKLFPMPENYGTDKALEGLQTRASVGNLIAQRMGTSTNQEQYLQQQIQSAQSSLSQLKDKVAKAGGGSSDKEMPQFKPNTQKNKRFLQRIEYGANLQSQKGNSFLPVTTDIAATAGYKISDHASAGLGMSYKLGWGNSIRQISLSNQGIGLRSYIDIKAKGSIWVAGGFEYNYMQEFAKWQDIENVDVWQKSALLGLQKKYKIGKKNSSMQLLYDFLWKTQVPRAQAFKFRIGYTF